MVEISGMETQCKVRLIHNTPLWVSADAARTCWQSHDKSDSCVVQTDNEYGVVFEKQCGPKDKELIDRIGNKFKHASTLEHVTYNFYLSDISRALLQELARHRIASLSVKSTRYTLKELKGEKPFTWIHGREALYKRASKYIVLTGILAVDNKSVHALENLRQLIQAGISNDKAKYSLPDSYKTELTWSINIRSLQNFLKLRTDKSALWEIRELAYAVYDALPEEHKYMFDHVLYNEKDANLDMELNIDELYIHNKNGETYKIVDMGLVVPNGDIWIPAILYSGMDKQQTGHSNKIVIAESEFREKFKKMEKE